MMQIQKVEEGIARCLAENMATTRIQAACESCKGSGGVCCGRGLIGVILPCPTLLETKGDECGSDNITLVSTIE